MYVTLANLTLDIPEDVTLEELTAVCTMLSARQAELSAQQQQQYRQYFPPIIVPCENTMILPDGTTFTQTHKGGR